ncbi:hypothetical protein ACRS64_27015 [Pseudomonas aeruginosa]|uniref:hypothetical protein n=1 Tax=Pseudomonas aeruginosa TaxID=287 RepID=UPI003DA781F4
MTAAKTLRHLVPGARLDQPDLHDLPADAALTKAPLIIEEIDDYFEPHLRSSRAHRRSPRIDYDVVIARALAAWPPAVLGGRKRRPAGPGDQRVEPVPPPENATCSRSTRAPGNSSTLPPGGFMRALMLKLHTDLFFGHLVACSRPDGPAAGGLRWCPGWYTPFMRKLDFRHGTRRTASCSPGSGRT